MQVRSSSPITPSLAPIGRKEHLIHSAFYLGALPLLPAMVGKDASPVTLKIIDSDLDETQQLLPAMCATTITEVRNSVVIASYVCNYNH